MTIRLLIKWYLSLFLTLLIFGLRQDGWSQADDVQKLRERITQFYTAIQMNQWDKAAEYIVENARSTFKSQPHGSIQGFNITEIKLEENKQTATVIVATKIMMPTIFRPLDIPTYTRWKLQAGDWFNDINDPPQTPEDKFREYYYNKMEARLKRPPNAPPLPVEVKFDRELIDFGLATKGTTLTLRFPFTNLSSKEIKIEKVYLQDQFMKDSTKKVSFKPGEKGEVVVDLDTSRLYRDVDQTIFVEFQPIQEIISLRTYGKVFTAKDLERHKPN